MTKTIDLETTPSCATTASSTTVKSSTWSVSAHSSARLFRADNPSGRSTGIEDPMAPQCPGRVTRRPRPLRRHDRRGTQPSHTIPAIKSFLDQHSGRATSFVGEPIWDGRTPAEIAEATRHESLTNLAFASSHTDILRPYETAGMPCKVLDDDYRTHPRMLSATGPVVIGHFESPDELCATMHWPLPQSPMSAVTYEAGADLGLVRRVVRDHESRAGVSETSRTLSSYSWNCAPTAFGTSAAKPE